MNTTSEALKLLEQARQATQAATVVIDDLIAPHDYQDVAALVCRAAFELIEATHALMQSQDESAFDALERAEDLLDSVYAIIDGETDE